jgi:RimJ/RimL family protein N-acetyltransferase
MSIQSAHMDLSGFRVFPVIETRRIMLRKIKPSDAEAIFKMRTNGRMNQFILREDMDQAADAGALVNKVSESYINKTAIGWAGVYKENNHLIGTCGFNAIDHENNRSEIVGEMMVDYWGKHLALEALDAMLDYGFTKLQLHSVEAKVLPENKSAIHLLKHLGFEREAYFRDRVFYNQEYHDLAVYSLLNY